MSKATMEVILFFVQIGALVALVIYVIKTWQMASATRESAKASQDMLAEMAEARDIESAPYVITYFDVPHGTHWIYLVVKNLGKSVAKDISMEFNPSLQNHEGDLGDKPPIPNRIGSLAPAQEIRTFYDSSITYFNNQSLPLSYSVTVTYSGGIAQKRRSTQQTLDLSAYKGIVFFIEKDMDDLVKQVEKLATSSERTSRQLEEISDRLSAGIWLKNSELMVSVLTPDRQAWTNMVLARLRIYQAIWSTVSDRPERLFGSFLADLRFQLSKLASNILILTANQPNATDPGTLATLEALYKALIELSQFRLLSDGGKSHKAMAARGTELTERVQALILKLGG